MEDYKKKYEKALARAGNLMNNSNTPLSEMCNDICIKIFPELKESEDERIRKTLVRFFTENYPEETEMYGSVLVKEAITWLEKQGECKDTFSIPTRETILAIWELGNDWKDITLGSTSTKYGTQLEYIQKHWQESEYYIEKQGEQKPTSDIRYEVNAEGSLSVVNGKPFDYEHATITQKDFAPKEDMVGKTKYKLTPFDKKVRDFLFSFYLKASDGMPLNEMIDAVHQLNTMLFEVEPKQEWSEEDEKMANDLIEGFLSSVSPYRLTHTSKEIVDWIKSIKCRMKGKED